MVVWLQGEVTLASATMGATDVAAGVRGSFTYEQKNLAYFNLVNWHRAGTEQLCRDELYTRRADGGYRRGYPKIPRHAR